MNRPAQGRKPPKLATAAPRTTQEPPCFLASNVAFPRPARRPTLREVKAIARHHLPAARERIARGHGSWADKALVKERTES